VSVTASVLPIGAVSSDHKAQHNISPECYD
jgi:hypothetical protein